ncbi:hypothetical protein [Alkalilimnicola ehrlichii]
MGELVKALLQGHNMKLARDIRVAYVEALIQLQEQFWREALMIAQAEYPEMFASLDPESVKADSVRTSCDRYYNGQRKNKHYGIFFRVPGMEGVTVGIGIDERIYTGISCDEETQPDNYRRCQTLLSELDDDYLYDAWWPLYRYPLPDFNFREPTAEALDTLVDSDARKKMVRSYIDELFRLWRMAAG